jgi:hypothetical protein
MKLQSAPGLPIALVHLALAGALALGALAASGARAQTVQAPLPSFAEMEAAGARIGVIRVLPQPIFDTSDPEEDRPLFRWANRMHVRTRPGVIERSLLFKPGDLLSVRVLDETERLLHAQRFLYDVQFKPVAWHDGVVDIDVLTRDTWSFDPGISVGHSGGITTSGLRLKEYNFLGTGVAVAVGRSRDVDRTSRELQLANTHLFGSWVSASYDHASNSDGRRDAFNVTRPFYELDARWALGVSASRDDRIDPVYVAGEVASEYRHRERKAEVFGGWSDGLVGGRVQRTSLGLNLQDDAYALEPGRVPPAVLPADEKLVGPFVRFEWIDDRYARVLNRNLIGRPEFYALGLVSKVQLGWAATALGSSHDALLYSASISRGFEPLPDHTLMTAASISGQYADGGIRRQRVSAQAQYYLHQSKRRLFYAGAFLDAYSRPGVADTLLVGGDDGLRGYPLRYQSGTRRALFTVEERFYTDIYLWRLFRIGGAAFVDVGRAWGGSNTNREEPGWLADAGAGLRIVSTRAAFGNVIHLDVAVPVRAPAGVSKVQFIVKTKTSF